MSYSFTCEICGQVFVSNTLELLEVTFLEHLTKFHTREEVLKMKELAIKAIEDPEAYRMLLSSIVDFEYAEHCKREKKVCDHR